MSDFEGWVLIITTLSTAIISIISAVRSGQAAGKAVVAASDAKTAAAITSLDVKQLKHTVNGQTDRLIAATEKAALSQGRNEGRLGEVARNEEKKS